MSISVFFGILLSILAIVYLVVFFWLRKQLNQTERKVIEVFLQKISKIPALIEVMRDSVFDKSAFETIIGLHSQSMIHEYDGIYLLLEQNARIQREFLFLMKLSVQIPELQKQEYFLYIRDFIIAYERQMQDTFTLYNRAVKRWNLFIQIKKYSIIGLLLPGASQAEIH